MCRQYVRPGARGSCFAGTFMPQIGAPLTGGTAQDAANLGRPGGAEQSATAGGGRRVTASSAWTAKRDARLT